MIRVIVSSLVLAACATPSPVRVSIQKVEVPVAIKCNLPTPVVEALPLYTGSDSSAILKSVLIDLESYRWYSKEVQASMLPCTEVAK